MSGSPKYSIFDLADEVVQMLQIKHEIAMQSLAAYREEELKRKRLERIQEQLTGRVYNQREMSRIESRLLCEKVSDRIAVLKADKIIMQWVRGEVEALEAKLTQIAAMIERGEWITVQAAVDTLLQETEDAVRRAEAMQLAEDRRQYVIQGIIEVMEEMGFVIQSGYPVLEYPDIPSSAAIIQAVRLGGGDIALSVPQQGEIWYEVNGFPMQTEESGAGQAVYSCDQAEIEIEKIHTLLEGSFGIKMGELRWEGKDHYRIRKTVRDLPGYVGAGCRRVR
jgi:hypothetical protein